jgi:hypothetical protein
VHTHRRSRSRVIGALAVLAAGAAGLTACASSTTTAGSVVSGSPSGVSSSPSGGVTPGGPILSPSPSPSSPGGSGVSGGSGKPTAPRPAHGIPITGYSTQGDVLTVYFFAGVCEKYGVTADQSQSDQVRVTVVVTSHAPTGQMCPMVISQQHASVDLGRPLDSRKVVDTTDAHTVAPQKTGLPMGAG